MNPLSPAALAGILIAISTIGRPAVVRALTLSQATIKALPGRKNKDIAEVQDQAAQVAEQMVQLAEAVYESGWTDPDAQSVADAIIAQHNA